jgi:hypothetical protein
MTVLLEVAISLIFIFLIFSIIVSGCCELWQLFTHKRGNFLYKALDGVFNDRLNKDFTFQLLSHPLIDCLRESDTKYPSYIGGSIFADALIDVIRCDHLKPELLFDHTAKKYNVKFPELTPPAENGGQIILEQFLKGTDQLNESDLKQLLRTFAFGANNYDDLKKNMAAWYDRYMGATSGWYKNYITRTLLVFSTIVTISFNIDSIHLVKTIFSDKTLRDRIVKNADVYVAKKLKEDSLQQVMQANAPVADSTELKKTEEKQIAEMKEAYEEVGLLDLPIGWPKPADQNIWLMVIGWMITIPALAYGADNWFNLLMKFFNARTSIKPKE